MFSDWSESTVRLASFIVILLAMLVWEKAAPRSLPHPQLAKRWAFNFGLVFFNTSLLRICLPVTAATAAELPWPQEFGLFRQLALPFWTEFVLTIIALDFLIYLQHVAFHAVPFLWTFHQVHHSDESLDSTTALRFHSVEILISAVLKIGAVVILGPTTISVISFEIILNGAAMFNHSNIKLPSSLDRALRAVFVTPNFHAIHHSEEPRKANSNFGFNLSCWDHLFRTHQTPDDE